ncbi:MAG: DUF4097 family beta strand repeat protein [Planctomycetes bacterium]|nr:DUF4097 family beta strand repeat protein [Planctomycetota bacterium]
MKPLAKILIVVAVLFFLLVSSAIVIGACAVGHLRINGHSVRSGIEANRVETHELAFDPAQPLRAQVDFGEIRVRSTTGTTASVTARLRAFGSDKADAEQRLAAMSLELGPNSVRGREKDNAGSGIFETYGGGQIDLELTLPAGARLEIQSGSGDLSVEGPFGDTRAASDYGDLELRGIRGALSAKSSSGDIHASELEGGDVSLDTSYGDLALERAKTGRLELHTSSGDIQVSEIQSSSTRLASEYGDIQVRTLRGDLEARTSSGEIALSAFSGKCVAHSDYGEVSASGVFAGLQLSSSSGAVHGEALAGSALGEGWKLESDYGEVALQLPASLSFELDASTDYGEVSADLPGVLGGAKGDEAHKLHGAVGGGGPKLRLHSSSGDVAIRTR